MPCPRLLRPTHFGVLRCAEEKGCAATTLWQRSPPSQGSPGGRADAGRGALTVPASGPPSPALNFDVTLAAQAADITVTSQQVSLCANTSRRHHRRINTSRRRGSGDVTASFLTTPPPTMVLSVTRGSDCEFTVNRIDGDGNPVPWPGPVSITIDITRDTPTTFTAAVPCS